jgi:hypothetical protein
VEVKHYRLIYCGRDGAPGGGCAGGG